MTSSLVSCIIPVFNGERFLAEAIESIMAQRYRPIEIIVADDGSEDGTRAIAARYGEPVRYFFQPNHGPATARNLGLGAARGNFIAFLDADDLWHPDKLALQMARFEARPDLDFSVAHAQNVWVDKGALEASRFKGHPRAQPVAGYVTGTLLARRSLFERLGGFDTGNLHADSMEWFIRVRTAGAIGELLPDVLLTRRIHGANRSRSLAASSRDEFLKLLKRQLDRSRSRDSDALPR